MAEKDSKFVRDELTNELNTIAKIIENNPNAKVIQDETTDPICVYRDGKGLDLVPLETLVPAINDSRQLLNTKGDFFTYLLSSTEGEQYEDLLYGIKCIGKQLTNFMVNLKNRRGVVCIPNAKYFMKGLEKCIDACNNKNDQEAFEIRNNFMQLYLDTINTCVVNNKKEAEKVNVKLPNASSNNEKTNEGRSKS